MSLFSYELDEKKIRATLQDAELEYNDAYWSNFDSSFAARPVKKTSNTPAFVKFNLNINRNILIPVFFIVALAGVSAIMFKFVDLKSSKNDEPVQKALIPDPSNYKIEKKIVSSEPKKELPKQEIATVKKDTIKSVVNTTPTPTVVLNQEVQIKNPVAKTKDSIPNTIVRNNETQVASTSNTVTVKKKRRRNRSAEQIDAIQAPLNLSSNSTPEAEPELKIK